MANEDDRLRSIWISRKRADSSRLIDEMTLAAWIDAGCPQDDEMEAWLAEDPRSREMLSFMRLQPPLDQAGCSPELLESLHGSIMEHIKKASETPVRRTVIGSIGVTSAAAAAAILVAALGFIFGQTAAPAANEATNDFVKAVTFDLLDGDSGDLDSIILATVLIAPDSTKGGEQ